MAEKEEQSAKVIVSAGGVQQQHHHHHHHRSGKKDETGEYRKRMRRHVDRVRLIRKWAYTVVSILAFIVLCMVFYAYVIDTF